MIFEWDEGKNQANIRKHRIDFADVPDVFDRPMYVALDSRKEYGEDRWVGIGFMGSGVVVVVYVERAQDTIRVISARKAEKHEWKKFKTEIGH